MKIVYKAQTIEYKRILKKHRYTSIQYTHGATYLLTRNAADEHVNLSIKIKRICSITNKQVTEVALTTSSLSAL